MATLTGTEQLWVVPVQSNGQPTANQEQCSVADIARVSSSGVTSVLIATPDNGTTQTLTAAMVSGAGDYIVHVTTGGTTPTLTLPTAAAIIANIPNAIIGSSYILRIINNNSGTATIVTNTGITLTGTATLLTVTSREFSVTMTGAATLTIVNIGAGGV